MDGLSLQSLLGVAEKFGLPGLLLVLWYFDQRKTDKILVAYRQDMEEQREMYENNARLCESYMDVTKDLRDIVIMNTQGYQRMDDKISTNQYCPYVRLKKQASGIQEG